MPKKIIYLDNAATTKVDERVLNAMLPYFSEKYGNASSSHELGLEAKKILETSREIIASSINAKPSEIIFTSGGTESNNLALKGLYFANKKSKTGKNEIITAKIEHDSILKTCEWLEEIEGAKIIYLNVDKEGFINLEQLKNSITNKTLVVSIIHANNEIGTIQNLEEIGKICREKKVLFHTDACQSFTKILIDVKKQNLDLVTINSHKIHGPKGIGALYIREGIRLIPLLHGGGHELRLRSGTEDIPEIAGFAEAVRIANKEEIKKMENLRNKLIERILKISGTKLNGPKNGKRLCNNINVSFSGLESEAIMAYLEKYQIYVSAGSACLSHASSEKSTSHVLRAIGLPAKEIAGAVRISISKYTTEKEIDFFLEKLKEIVERLRGVR